MVGGLGPHRLYSSSEVNSTCGSWHWTMKVSNALGPLNMGSTNMGLRRVPGQAGQTQTVVVRCMQLETFLGRVHKVTVHTGGTLCALHQIQGHIWRSSPFRRINMPAQEPTCCRRSPQT